MMTRVKETVQSLEARRSVIWLFFIAAGIFVPAGFHRLGLGVAFLPMHIPVFIGAFLCGPYMGMAGAVCTVVLSCLITGMPPVFPTGVCMMAELAAYAGVCAGIMKNRSYTMPSLYGALIAGIVAGRLVNGIAGALTAGIVGESYSLSAFVEGSVISTIPGTILLLCVVPGLVMLLESVLGFHKRGSGE